MRFAGRFILLGIRRRPHRRYLGTGRGVSIGRAVSTQALTQCVDRLFRCIGPGLQLHVLQPCNETIIRLEKPEQGSIFCKAEHAMPVKHTIGGHPCARDMPSVLLIPR